MNTILIYIVLILGTAIVVSSLVAGCFLLHRHSKFEKISRALYVSNLAALYYAQGKNNAEIRNLLQESLDITKATLGERHLNVIISLDNLAELFYKKQGYYGEAESLYREALEIAEITLGKQHIEIATRLDNLAELCIIQQRYDEAEPFCNRSIDIRKRSKCDLVRSVETLAKVYQGQGKIPNPLPPFPSRYL